MSEKKSMSEKECFENGVLGQAIEGCQCDECERIDGDYDEPMFFNAENGMFQCRRGHFESIGENFRHVIDGGLFDRIVEVYDLFANYSLYVEAKIEVGEIPLKLADWNEFNKAIKEE